MIGIQRAMLRAEMLLLTLCSIAPCTALLTQDPVYPPAIRTLAYSPNGMWLAAASGEPDEPGVVVVWNLKTRKQQFTPREGPPAFRVSRSHQKATSWPSEPSPTSASSSIPPLAR